MRDALTLTLIKTLVDESGGPGACLAGFECRCHLETVVQRWTDDLILQYLGFLICEMGK